MEIYEKKTYYSSVGKADRKVLAVYMSINSPQVFNLQNINRFVLLFYFACLWLLFRLFRLPMIKTDVFELFFVVVNHLVQSMSNFAPNKNSKSH